MNLTNDFFLFGNNSSKEKKFTWAMDYIPKSEMININCSKCGRIEKYPSAEFDVNLKGGDFFPDNLGCGHYPFLIFSETVINTLVDCGISCFKKYMVGIANIETQSKILLRESSPKYYRVEISGNCKIDIEKSGLHIDSICDNCKKIITTPPIFSKISLDLNTWDGCDMFRDNEYFPRLHLCSSRFKEIITTNACSNFRFRPLTKLH